MTLEVSVRHDFTSFALDASFEAPAGLTALFGRSGSGKTSIVNAVAGIFRPATSRIVADGEVLADTVRGVWVPPHRRRIGYVFQDGRLFPHLSVRGNLVYGQRFLTTRPGHEDFDRVVDLLGIGALLDRQPGALSGGERQRVAIGRAILSRPRLLLMDEPLAALDEPRKAQILPYLERLRDAAGLPILYVSHAASEVARLATTVVVIEDGRVTASGPVAQVLSDPAAAHGFGLREMGAVLTARVAAHEADGLTRLEVAGGSLWLPRLETAPGGAVRVRILAQDVMLALARPEGISALNVLPVTVRGVRMGEGPGALVRLTVGESPILARITRRSAEVLGITPGQRLFAVLKSVSVAPENVGIAGLSAGDPPTA